MKKKRMGWFLILIPVLAAVALWAVFGMNRETAMAVSLGQVQSGTLTQTVTVSGTLAAADEEDIPVSAARKITAVHVKEGDRVQAGALLAEFDTTDLELQRERLQVSLASLEAELLETKSPTLRSDVANTRSRVAQLSLNLENATRQLREAEGKLAADKALFEAGALSAQSLETSQSSRDSLANSVSVAEEALAAARVDSADIPAGKALAQNSLERQLQQVELDLQRVALQIADSRIEAGMAGEVLDFPLKEGRFPAQGSVIRIRDLSTWDTVVYLTQEDAVRITAGQAATLVVKGLPGSWPATVSDIAREAAGEAGSGSRTPKVKVTLRVQADEERFASGYDVDVSIQTGQSENARLVPAEAILRDAGGSPGLLIVDTEASSTSDTTVTGRVRVVPATPGLATEAWVDIGSSVPDGSVFVLPPADGVTEGSLVTGTIKENGQVAP